MAVGVESDVEKIAKFSSHNRREIAGREAV